MIFSVQVIFGCAIAFTNSNISDVQKSVEIPNINPISDPDVLIFKIPAELKGADGGMSLKAFFDKISKAENLYPAPIPSGTPQKKSDPILEGNRHARVLHLG